jgi:hypothetical protein
VLTIDHVAMIVPNLYEGCRRFTEETGLSTIEGGYFTGYGVANRLIPTLDTTFVELESSIDDRRAEKSRRGGWFRDVAAEGEIWAGLCLRYDTIEELEATAERLGSKVRADSAGEANGVVEVSSYVMADGEVHPPQPRTPPGSVWERGLPTFFKMDTDNHVGNVEVPYTKRKPAGISWVEMGGSKARMQDWIDADPDDLGIRCNGRAPGMYAVAIRTVGGDDIVIRRRDW